MLIGLTGSLGSGKSTVLKIFEQLGARTISADAVVHDLLEDEEIKKELKAMFGQEIFDNDGQIDRKKLAQLVFSDQEARKRLEELLHPLVYERVNDFYQEQPQGITVAEIPLLFETGSQSRFHKVITVYTTPEISVKRLKARGMTPDEIEARLKSQLPIETKLEKADFIIDNSRGLDATKKQVQEIMAQLRLEETRNQHET